MSRILSFLISILFFAVAFVCNAEKVDYTTAKYDTQAQTLPMSDEAFDASPSSLEFFLPTQIIGANAFRVQHTVKRTCSAQKNNYEFAKYGKVFGAAIKHFNQTKPLSFQYLFAKSGHRMVCLGKLII